MYKSSDESQMMMEQSGKGGMDHMMMNMYGCHTTMYVFSFLVIVGLIVQVVLQTKMLKELRRRK